MPGEVLIESPTKVSRSIIHSCVFLKGGGTQKVVVDVSFNIVVIDKPVDFSQGQKVMTTMTSDLPNK